MTRLLPTLWCLVLILASGVSNAVQPLPRLAQGLQVSLTTSAYRVAVASDLAAPAASRAKSIADPQPAISFVASASLNNLSNSDLTVNFSTPAAAASRFQFRVLDSTGTVVWTSDDGVSGQVITPATLRRHARWSKTVNVPLKVNDAWLPAGKYTLEAIIGGDVQIGATTAFEVVWPTLTTGTGIRGQVREYYTDPDPNVVYIMAPNRGAAAILTITQITEGEASAGFLWSGLTDPSGQFKVLTPPGRFKVKAQAFDSGGIVHPDAAGVVGPNPRTVETEITVEQGSFATPVLFLPALQAPPVADPLVTGIAGTVRQSTGIYHPVTTNSTESSIITIGLPVRATVIVEELATTETGPLAPVTGGFTWTGTTDTLGKYQVATTAGSFRVSVYRNLGTFGGIADLQRLATRDVTVIEGSVTAANFLINPQTGPIILNTP